MKYFKIIKGEGPVIGAAIHSGHYVREEIREKFLITEDVRLREEDPFTDRFIEFAPTRITVNSSRFEFDVNRPPGKAVYLSPEDAWGLHIWKQAPPKDCIERSLGLYERFYKEIKDLLDEYVSRNKKVFIYDVHSYNHRRKGPGEQPEDPAENPDINIGSGNTDRDYWKELIEDFINDLSGFDFNGSRLNIGENVKFRGGYFSEWIFKNYRKEICVLAVEIKKIYMDEWTGEVYNDKVELLKKALASTVPSVLGNLEKAGIRS
jgi:N-formylglutamate deformylase